MFLLINKMKQPEYLHPTTLETARLLNKFLDLGTFQKLCFNA